MIVASKGAAMLMISPASMVPTSDSVVAVLDDFGKPPASPGCKGDGASGGSPVLGQRKMVMANATARTLAIAITIRRKARLDAPRLGGVDLVFIGC